MKEPVPLAMQEFDLAQLAAAAFAARGITKGLWHVAMKLQFAGLTADWADGGGGVTGAIPTGMIGVVGVALLPVTEPGPLVFDAAAFQAPNAKAGPQRPPRKARAE